MMFFLACLLIISCQQVPDSPVSELGPPLVDIDGNAYRTLNIGDQVWMVENLRVSHYRNGDAIPRVPEAGAWRSTASGACCFYENNDTHADTYGYLYNGLAVSDARNIAPDGWHVARDDEWKELEIYLGMSRSEADKFDYRGTDEGSLLKSRSGWYTGIEPGVSYPNGYSPPHYAGNGSDNFGFNILAAGSRYWGNGNYYDLGRKAIYWTTTQADPGWLVIREFSYIGEEILRSTSLVANAYSIRCVKDPP